MGFSLLWVLLGLFLGEIDTLIDRVGIVKPKIEQYGVSWRRLQRHILILAAIHAQISFKCRTAGNGSIELCTCGLLINSYVHIRLNCRIRINILGVWIGHALVDAHSHVAVFILPRRDYWKLRTIRGFLTTCDRMSWATTTSGVPTSG